VTKDILFLLAAPLDDPNLPGGPWFCPHCALIQGALMANPHWAEAVDIKRVPFPRPRPVVVAFLGEGAQACPSLIFTDPEKAPRNAKQSNGRLFSNDAAVIAQYLADRFGGAAPHP
jgi:hypothetical protein